METAALQACDSWGALPQNGRSCSSPPRLPSSARVRAQVLGKGPAVRPVRPAWGARGLDVSCPGDWPTGTGASWVGMAAARWAWPHSAPLGTKGSLGKGGYLPVAEMRDGSWERRAHGDCARKPDDSASFLLCGRSLRGLQALGPLWSDASCVVWRLCSQDTPSPPDGVAGAGRGQIGLPEATGQASPGETFCLHPRAGGG